MFAVFPRPLDPQIPVAFESAEKPDLRDIPRNAADEDFARVDGVAVDSRRQNTAPSASGFANCGGVSVETRRSFDRKRIVGRSAEQLVGTGRPLKRMGRSAATAVAVVETAAVRDQLGRISPASIGTVMVAAVVVARVERRAGRRKPEGALRRVLRRGRIMLHSMVTAAVVMVVMLVSMGIISEERVVALVMSGGFSLSQRIWRELEIGGVNRLTGSGRVSADTGAANAATVGRQS